jgi:hypothetical protein
LKSLESSTVTFVVTIWVDLESNGENANSHNWRGEIRDVMCDQKTRTTFVTLEEIAEYIRPYLAERGVSFQS